jgi:sugar/nucleoside kinase (ribokinase family)
MKTQPSRTDVVFAGLALVDLLGRPVDIQHPPRRGGLQLLDSMTLTTGGNVANCGIDLAKLGFRVGAISRVGNDPLGDFVLRHLAEYRIDTSGVTVDRRAQTSATFVAVEKGGERTFFHTRGCLRNFRVTDILRHLPLIERTKVFALGYLGLLPECEPHLPRLFRAVKTKTGAATLLDTGGNPRRDPALLKRTLPWVDYFIPSREEAAILTGESAPDAMVRKFRQWGACGVVGIKLGAHGCYITNDGHEEYLPVVKVRRVVDATGAGDAFVAGFLAATLRGFAPVDAARRANAIAASCVTAVGASTAIKPFGSYR